MMRTARTLAPAVLLLLVPIAAGAQARYAALRQDGEARIVLRDEEAGLEATLAPAAGGELCSLRYRWKQQWVELLYRACQYEPAPGWRGKAPLLWPATGGTFAPSDPPGQPSGHYTVGQTTYRMPFHGFAQNLPWKAGLVHAGPRQAAAVLDLASNEQTRRLYPFDFLLSADYRVAEGRLTIRYTVIASKQNKDEMFFSIGNHITFRTPLLPGSEPGLTRITTPARLLLVKDARNLPTGETAPAPFSKGVLLRDVESNRAISLGGYPSDPVLTMEDPQGLRVRLRHRARWLPAQPLVQFNLFGDAQAGFFSPEPWVGAQNSLQSRRGLVFLKPGQDWDWTIEIEPLLFVKM